MDQDKIPRKKQLTLMNFSTEIAESLCKAGKSEAPCAQGRPSLENSIAATPPPMKRRPPAVADPAVDVRFDMLGHFPLFGEKQQRCRLCKTGYTKVSCIKCQVNLYLHKNKMF